MMLWLMLWTAGAETFDQMTQGLNPGLNRAWQIHGYHRIRSNGYYNLDLDRGLTTSGIPVFPASSAKS